MRGWCGKDIDGTGAVHNLVRRDSASGEGPGGALRVGPSLLDGRPAVIVDYTHSMKPPRNRVQGELRWLVPGSELLGVLVLPLGPARIGPFPFRLTRSG